MNKINLIQNNNFNTFCGFKTKIAKKFAKMGEIGEGTSIACDFIGKAVIVPAVIMGVSKEEEQKKEFSAFKNPVAAVIQLALEVPVLICGSKITENLADSGYFDKKNSDFSYNQKKFKDEFITSFQKFFPNENGIIEKIKQQGYSKDIAQDYAEYIKTADEHIKGALDTSFKKFETTYKNQFHLKNRICFLCALILTPLLCALENYIHPKVMKKIFKYEADHKKNKKHILKLDIHKFIERTRKKNTKNAITKNSFQHSKF